MRETSATGVIELETRVSELRDAEQEARSQLEALGTERAQNLAKQILNNQLLDRSGRARSLYLRILNRQATAQEVDRGLSYVDGFQKRGIGLVDAWTSFGRILLASNEYIYLD